MRTTLALIIGFSLDLLLGDPLWLPHPVVGMGKLIALLEKVLRRLFPATKGGELTAGAVMAATVPAVSCGLVLVLLWLCGLFHPLLALAVESFLCYQALAQRGLIRASRKVQDCLEDKDLPAARKAVGQIVGRDTAVLSAEGVTRAAVETVAENTSDGVIAPLFYLALGGAPLGMLYKAINTMDSMVGYRNEQYENFGKCAAKLDDLANWFPARISAVLMVLAAFLLGQDAKSAFAIWRRDRYNHKSPNSAQTEAACAGALGIQLGGNASYFGKVVEKPTIGDAKRPVEPGDIARANRLLMGTSLLALVLFLAARILFLLGGQYL